MGMAWPSTLPRPLLEGYSTTPGNEIVRTDMESGEARTRRRSVSAPDSIKLSWLLDATQMSQFRAYWDAELAGGAAWCDMSIDVGNGIEQKAVRVIGQYTALKVSAAHWKVSCEAEVRKLRSSVFDYLNLMGLPSLDLDFAGTQSLDPVITSSRQPAPVVSFSRSSTATYIGADGLLKTADLNEPRFDYDPISHVCKGLLIEESRTNLLLYSEDLSGSGWSASGASVSVNAVAAPDGSMTADKLVESATTATHYIGRSASITSGVTYSVQFFAKAAERSVVQLASNSAAFPATHINFDLSAGTVSALGASISGSIAPLSGGWFLCQATLTATATSSTPLGYIVIANSPTMGRFASYAGDGTGGLYLWGTQLEAGASPSSYIPTTSAAVARASDVAWMAGESLSSWYRPDEGCFVSALDVFGVYSGFDATVFAVNNGTQNEQIDLRAFTTGVGGRVRVGGTNQSSSAQSPAPALGSTYRVAVAYKTNDQAYATNGVATATDVLCAVPSSVSKFEIGSRVASGYLNGHISRLTYYPKRLPNATLQALSA